MLSRALRSRAPCNSAHFSASGERTNSAKKRAEEKTMTSVHLALGQTGADVSQHFWKIAAAEAADADDKNRRKGALFDVRRQPARAIIIDGDDRALEGCQLLGGKRPVFDSRNIVTKGNFGCGKCFGMGFSKREELRMMAEERLRREAERCSRVDTLSFLFSIDGGSSGLASALLQGARDDYPTSTLLQPHFVAPAPPGVVGETRARLQELKTTANFGRRGKRHINNSHSQASGGLVARDARGSSSGYGAADPRNSSRPRRRNETSRSAY